MISLRGMSKNLFKLRQSLLLLLAAAIWGFAFVAQSVGMNYVQPYTFTAVRFLLGAAALLPVILIQNAHAAGRRRRGETPFKDAPARSGKELWKGGILCGTALVAATSVQQFGLVKTTVGKAGFITTMYIIIVPILGIFLGKKVKPLIAVCVVIAAAGLYMLCMTEGFSLQAGDALCLACAFLFSVQIMLVDHYANRVDGIRLAAIQFITASAIAAVLMLLFETPDWGSIVDAGIPILYTGIMSSGVAYTLQIVGQRGLNPTVASLIMSMESVMSALAGYLILHQTFTGRELAGCILMGLAIVLAQL